MKKSIIILTTLIIGCNNGENQKLEVLQDEVMAIHDVVMPKMGEIMSLKEQLNTSLAANDSTKANYGAVKVASDSLTNLLTEADNKMMDWMDEYNADTLKAISVEDGIKYLMDEKSKITAVKELTDKNIEAVKQYLKK